MLAAVAGAVIAIAAHDTSNASAYVIPAQWTAQPVSGPAARDLATLAFAPGGGEVLFGGSLDNSPNGVADTWLYRAGSWTRMAPSASPAARVGAVMAYDSNLQRTVLFGGYVNGAAASDTWAWDGSNWQPVATTQAPPPRAFGAMVYDVARGQLVLFGGSSLANGNAGAGLYNDTWAFDGDWHQLSPVYGPPPARSWHALAYDSGRRVTVLYGGYNGNLLGDTWEWDGASWQQRFPAHSPGGRYQQAASYDPHVAQAFVFGGLGPSGIAAGDTWGFDGTDWNQAPTSPAPSARTEAAAAYDLLGNATVLFGGADSNQPGSSHVLGDTWQLAYATPVFTANPSSLDFGNVDVGVPATRTVAVSNTGNGALSIGSVLLTGLNASDFVIASDSCSNASLATGVSCAVTVSLTYTAQSDCRQCSAQLFFPTGFQVAYQVPLTGTLVLPSPVRTPTSFEFGDVPVGASSATDLGLANAGDGDLLISRIYAVSGDYTTTSDCPPALHPGASCGIHVVFAPSVLGLDNSQVIVLDNLPPGFEFYGVGGTGIATPVQLSLAPATGTYGGSTDLSVHAATPAGQPLAQLLITLTLPNGVTAQVTSDASGNAALDGVSLAGLAAAGYPGGLSASFAGDTAHSAATAGADLTVSPAPLIVTVNDASRQYGMPNPVFTVAASGLVNGDGMAALGQPSFQTSAGPDSEVGDYPVVVSGLASPNYVINVFPGTLHVVPAVVVMNGLSASPLAPNTTIQFSDSVNATLTLQTPAGVQPVGQITFAVNGHALPSVATGGSPSVSSKFRLDQQLVPGAGAYALSAVFAPGNKNFTGASASASLSVAPEGATLTYSGDYLVTEGSPLSLAVIADQRSPAGDLEFADYALVPVWIRFDVTGPGVVLTLFAPLADALDWNTSGRGQAQATLNSLPAGAYVVTAHLVASNGAPVAGGSPFLAGDGVRIGVAVSPASGSYATGAGFIGSDASANAGDPQGHFGFMAHSRSGRLTGSAFYGYRASLSQGGASRDVDVVMSSTTLTGFGPAGKGAAYVSGTCTSSYFDSVTGSAVGTSTPCTFTIIASPDSASAPAQFAVTIQAADGSLLHSASGPVAGGSLHVHL